MLEPARKNIGRLLRAASILEDNHPTDIKIICYLFSAEIPLQLDMIAIGLPVEKMLNRINELHRRGVIIKFGRGTKWKLTDRGNALAEEWALRMDG